MSNNPLIQQIEQLCQINREEHAKFLHEKQAHASSYTQLNALAKQLEEQKNQNYRMSEQISKVEVQKKHLTQSIGHIESELEQIRNVRHHHFLFQLDMFVVFQLIF